MDYSLKIPILYVDDEKVNLLAFRANFRREYEVHTASSGEEGKKLLEEHNIKIVVADQRMPKMTGVEFFNWIQEDHPDTIRILLTGFTDISAVIEAINKGKIYAYITKPWREDELKQTFDAGIIQSQRFEYLKSLEDSNGHLFNESSDAILLINNDGSVNKSNSSATQLFGYSQEELDNNNIKALFGDFDSIEEVLNASGKSNQTIITKANENVSASINAIRVNCSGKANDAIQVIIKQA